MIPKSMRGCVGAVLFFNIFVVSALLGSGFGILGWIIPPLLVAVCYLLVTTLFDLLLLAIGEPIGGAEPPRTHKPLDDPQ